MLYGDICAFQEHRHITQRGATCKLFTSVQIFPAGRIIEAVIRQLLRYLIDFNLQPKNANISIAAPNKLLISCAPVFKQLQRAVIHAGGENISRPHYIVIIITFRDNYR